MKNNIFTTSPNDWTFAQKAWFTIALIVVYRIGVTIPLPFVDAGVFEGAIKTSTAAGSLVTAMTMVGSSIAQMGVFALGVMPFITASIVMQLMKVVFPKIKEMYEGDATKKIITQWTRYLAIVIAIIQGAGILIGSERMLGVDVFTTKSWVAFVIALFAMVVGSVIVMRLGEEITLKGVSNGTSLLIFTSILASLPTLMTQSYISKSWIGVIIFSAILLAVLALVAYVEKSEYKVPVVYPKTSVGAGSTRNNLPIKVAIAGVLPVIFASSLMSLPLMASAITQWEWVKWVERYFTFGTGLYAAVFVLLTIAATFFSVPLVFDPHQIATQIRANGGTVDNKRPGTETEKFLAYVSQKMAGLDSVYLVLISLATLYLFPLSGLAGGAFGATSIIILATVAVTLFAAIKAETSTKNLKDYSFLRPEGAKLNEKRKRRIFSRK